MKRIMKTGVLMLAVAMMLTLGACSASSSKSYTFNVETGDTIKVKLDTSNGLSLSQKDGQFTVKRMKKTFYKECLSMKPDITVIWLSKVSRECVCWRIQKRMEIPIICMK
ncbi:MAG: hypothetical protein ACLRL6_01170 [Clostridium sp.]